jgi:hypothetical protein
MEVFLDFGLFELIAALGVAAMARAVYSRKAAGLAFLGASILVPVALLFLVRGGAATWLAAACVATALVNGVVVLGAFQRGEVRVPTVPKWRGRSPRGTLRESGKLGRDDLLAVRTDHDAPATGQGRREVHP